MAPALFNLPGSECILHDSLNPYCRVPPAQRQLPAQAGVNMPLQAVSNPKTLSCLLPDLASDQYATLRSLEEHLCIA